MKRTIGILMLIMAAVGYILVMGSLIGWDAQAALFAAKTIGMIALFIAWIIIAVFLIYKRP